MLMADRGGQMQAAQHIVKTRSNTMPGFDGTGPHGMGPMTGGGFGRCSGDARYGNSGFGRGGGYSAGRGRGRGLGRCAVPGGMTRGGMGRGFGGVFAAPSMTPEQEKELLESRLELLEQEANRIKEQLDSRDS